MAEDAFGLPNTPVEETEEFAWLADETPAENGPTTTEEQPAAEETPQPDPAIPQVEAPEVEAPAETEETPEPQETTERLYAGKYKTVEEVERGYRELSDLWRRTSEGSKANEQRARELEAQNARLQSEIARVAPVLQQAVAAQQAAAQKPQFDQYGDPVAPPAQPTPQAAPTPQQVAAFVERQVAEQSRNRDNQMRIELAAQREQQEALGALTEFFSENGITRGDETDGAMVDTIAYLNDSWQDATVELGNKESLGIVKEATERPALREILALKPQYFDSDAGLTLARMEASVLEGNAATQTTAAVPASQVGSTDGQRKPVTERASGGASAPSNNPSGDPWLEAVAAYRGDAQRAGGIFFE